MSRKIFLIMMVLVLIPSVVLAGKYGKGRGKTGTMNVLVREVIVRQAPNYLGPQAGKIYYGDQVNVTATEGNWVMIDHPSGWIPKNTVTKLKVKINPDQKYSKGTTAKHDEVALAGKGFNPQVEAQYKKNNRELARGYARLDQIERFGATDNQIKTFRRAGKLQMR